MSLSLLQISEDRSCSICMQFVISCHHLDHSKPDILCYKVPSLINELKDHLYVPFFIHSKALCEDSHLEGELLTQAEFCDWEVLEELTHNLLSIGFITHAEDKVHCTLPDADIRIIKCRYNLCLVGLHVMEQFWNDGNTRHILEAKVSDVGFSDINELPKKRYTNCCELLLSIQVHDCCYCFKQDCMNCIVLVDVLYNFSFIQDGAEDRLK
mmetsp:Transcript_9049/g.10462  ORF Transcript_9049/g.10462 Transcript_9049/m.10462 type:complete len:211 (-) Transcript_9049:193-825(-)